MSVLQPFLLAWRSLRRSPVFTVAAVLTLAIGIGSAAAIFAVVNGVLLRPLPYGHPDRLVGAWHNLPPLSLSRANQTSATYQTYKRFARSLEGIGIYQEGAVNVADPNGAGEPQRLRAAFTTADLVPLLEVSPRLGRSFTEAEDLPKGPAVLMISEGLWRSRYAANPDVLGRTLYVNGEPRQIVGVMPTSFRFPDARTQVWLPLALDPNAQYADGFSYNGIARLKAGVTIERAQRELTNVLPRILEVSAFVAPGVPTQMLLDQAKPQPVLTPMREDVVGGVSRTLWVVAATAALVLLVACANVANLMLVRADGRQRELAVRAAMGAGRSRVIAHFVTEATVLAALAGALGLGVAVLGIGLLVSAGPAELPRLAEVKVDASVVLFTTGLVAFVALACSVIPALRFSHAGLASSLREGGRSGTAGRSRQRARSTLVAAQIALALVVLAGSALLLRSFQRLHAVRPGFDASDVATLWLALPSARYANDSSVVRFYQGLTARIAELPGVRGVGLTSRLPLMPDGLNSTPIWPEGDAAATQKLPPLQLFTTTDGGYFRAMGIPLLAGRTFDRADGRQHWNEAIVSRSTAAYFWKDSTGRAAIGKRFQTLPGGPWYTVVGVAGATRDTALQAPPSAAVYFPQVVYADTLFGMMQRTMAIVVRAAGEPGVVSRSVRRLVRELDPTLPVFNVRSMEEVMSRSMAQLSFTMIVLGVAAGVTLLLGAIGLYGVVAYVVSMRTREFGVRIALGSPPRAVARMVARQGVAITGIGITAGLLVFALLAKFLRSLLFDVAPWDPLTLAAVAAALFAVAALASWIPARRAARLDPMEALRAE